MSTVVPGLEIDVAPLEGADLGGPQLTSLPRSAVIAIAGSPSGGACPASGASRSGRGAVLLYAAGDAPSIVRSRLVGICVAAHVPLDSLDVHVIVDPVVGLDDDGATPSSASTTTATASVPSPPSDQAAGIAWNVTPDGSYWGGAPTPSRTTFSSSASLAASGRS